MTMKLRNLAQMRIKAKLTQEKLGRKIGMTGRQVSRWEAGDAFPSACAMERLVRVFKCREIDLIGTDDGGDSK